MEKFSSLAAGLDIRFRLDVGEASTSRWPIELFQGGIKPSIKGGMHHVAIAWQLSVTKRFVIFADTSFLKLS